VAYETLQSIPPEEFPDSLVGDLRVAACHIPPTETFNESPKLSRPYDSPTLFLEQINVFAQLMKFTGFTMLRHRGHWFFPIP